MVFLENMGEVAPDRERAVVIYDDSGATLTARTAKEKLKRAGYRHVAILEGGLRAWREAGFAVETPVPAAPEPVIADGVYRIDAGKSVVEWTGRNINNRHYGRIAIAAGEVVLKNGLPVSGTCTLDMKTITDLDLQDEGWRTMLIRHLKSEDFFDVERYPAATFELHGAAARAGGTPGNPNVDLTGLLKIRDMVRSVSFPAIIAAQEDGSVKAQATLDLDRTLWGASYGSGKLYERLGMHLVNDLIGIDLFIVARTAA
jgi:polyisoprenoid-binding protein YceI